MTECPRAWRTWSLPSSSSAALPASVPFSEVESVEAAQGILTVVFPGGTARFDLGKRAERWAKAIRQPKTRLQKLGVKTGARVLLVGLEDESFLRELREEGAEVRTRRSRGGFDGRFDMVFLLADGAPRLKSLGELTGAIKEDGGIWVLRRKGSKEVTEAGVLAAGRESGLVDVKVVAFSETLSALKFVIPLSERSGPSGRRTSRKKETT